MLMEYLFNYRSQFSKARQNKIDDLLKKELSFFMGYLYP